MQEKERERNVHIGRAENIRVMANKLQLVSCGCVFDISLTFDGDDWLLLITSVDI